MTRAPLSLSSEEFALPTSFVTKLAYKQHLLRTAERLGKAARVTNAERARRYKEAYDRAVRPREALKPGDFVFVKSGLAASKLLFPVSGPHEVVRVRDAVITVRTSAGEQTVHVDRTAKVPENHPGPEPDDASTDDERVEAAMSEFVVDRVVTHRKESDGRVSLRVRWAGFDATDDTWEESTSLPRHFVERYARRKRIQVSQLLPSASSAE
jgi:hypothetical protein